MSIADGTPATQINALATHPTLPILVTAHEDRYIRMFDLTTGMYILSRRREQSNYGCWSRRMHQVCAGARGRRYGDRYRSGWLTSRLRRPRLQFTLLGPASDPDLPSRDGDASAESRRRDSGRSVPPFSTLCSVGRRRWMLSNLFAVNEFNEKIEEVFSKVYGADSKSKYMQNESARFRNRKRTKVPKTEILGRCGHAGLEPLSILGR